MAITSINPATGETLREYQDLSGGAIEQKLATAARASGAQRRSGFSERAAILLTEDQAFAASPTSAFSTSMTTMARETSTCFG
jgi:succinate-semialdehyde dehydrogenase/glutarate-semialdehyde dehydrogenase